MILYGERESEALRSERIEQDAAPEPRCSPARVKAEEYDEGGGLVNPVAWRLHRDIPEPTEPDPWEPFDCEVCSETYNGTFCTHGKCLCAACTAVGCQSCACEEADALAINEERRREYWR